ncbi:MAG: hypothetical protein ACE5HD_01855 [Acidobacteriota bacterium]
MGTAVSISELRLKVADISGQKEAEILDAAPDSTVGEFIEELLPQMNMPRVDAEGRPLVYQAHLDREGRHLHGSERLADAVQSGDRLVLQPNIDAGGAGA